MKFPRPEKINRSKLSDTALIIIVAVVALAGGLLLYHDEHFSIRVYAGSLHWQDVGTVIGTPSSIEFSTCQVVDNPSIWTIRGLARLFPPLPYFNSTDIVKYTWQMNDYSDSTGTTVLNQVTTNYWYAGEASQQQFIINPKVTNIIQFYGENDMRGVQINADQIKPCSF